MQGSIMDDITTQAEEDARVLGSKLGLSRRALLAATTGMAAAAVAGVGASSAHAAGPVAAAGPKGGNGVLVPPGKRGIILYTVRDAISRNPETTDPSLPSGFKAVLEELAKIGYKQVEFAGYRQNSNAPGGNVDNVEGAHQLRQWLDDNGLEAEGNHGSIPGNLSDSSIASFDAACEIANILGLGHIGTGSDPTSSSYLADWQAAAERWNFLGERAATHGLKLYTHNHSPAYSFLLDSGPLDGLGRPTRSSGLRRLEWFLQNTDPAYVYLELDIYWAHVAQYQHQQYTAPNGDIVEDIFDPAALVAAQPIRFPLFHAKDGVSQPGSSNGYSIVPFGQGDIDYTTFFQRVGAKGYHNPMYEQDNASNTPMSSPSMSMENAATSFAHMASLRG